MKLEISNHNQVATAAVSGDITHAVSMDFQNSLLEALRSSSGLVLKCSGIGMLTSAGLRTLLLLHREAAGSGKVLALAEVPPPVRDVMEVTGFWDQFSTYSTADEALNHLTA